MTTYGTLTAPDTLRMERVLPGPIERVWEFLTDAKKRRLWLADGEMANHPGGHVELIFRNSELAENDNIAPAKYADVAGEFCTTGEITRFEPPFRLSFIWIENTEVCFDLTEERDKVVLVLTHKRIDNRATLLSVSGGWHTHLDILVEVLNKRKPTEFWQKIVRLEDEYTQRFFPPH